VIGLDSNVLVRYVAQDEPRQATRASRLLEEELTADRPGFVSLVALAETAWVLESVYAADRPTILRVVRGLLGAANVRVQESEAVALAADDVESTAIDFADALIARVARSHGCAHTLTFDRRAARQRGFQPLE
jgi:predicted nucleic-acid-binding protein